MLFDHAASSPNRAAVLDLLDQGALNADTLARDLLGWLSDDEVKTFCQRNDIPLNKEQP